MNWIAFGVVLALVLVLAAVQTGRVSVLDLLGALVLGLIVGKLANMKKVTAPKS